jgi:hypothetical protein
MSMYKELAVVEGTKYMQLVWNFFFAPISEEEFFVQPWGNRELADCAEFQVDQKKGLLVGIMFFVSDKKLKSFLLNTQGDLYLFGAFNQINVCQMRSKGIVTSEESHPKTEAIKKRLRAKILERTKTMISKLSEEEARIRFNILDRGKLFCFHPENYAYATYERG